MTHKTKVKTEIREAMPYERVSSKNAQYYVPSYYLALDTVWEDAQMIQEWIETHSEGHATISANFIFFERRTDAALFKLMFE